MYQKINMRVFNAKKALNILKLLSCGSIITAFAVTVRLPEVGEGVQKNIVSRTAPALFYNAEAKFKLPDIARLSLATVIHREQAPQNTPVPAAPIPQETPAPAFFKEPKVLSVTSTAIPNTTPIEGIYLQNDSGYPIDVDALLGRPIKFSKSEEPTVLIYHTHTSEAYTQTETSQYNESDPKRSEDTAFNICSVGEEITKALQTDGINVIHDTTSHDFPSYSGCYARSMDTASAYIEKYPSIQLVLDIHRDAMTKPDGTEVKVCADIDDKKVAQVMIVVGTDKNGLEHPQWQENVTMGLHLQRALVAMNESFARPVNIRKERFNGHLSTGALLIEVGSAGNTLSEAKESGKLLGEVISKMIKDSQ